MEDANFDIDDIIAAINNGSIKSVKNVNWKNLAQAAYASEHAEKPLPFVLFLYGILAPIHVREYRREALFVIVEHLQEYIQELGATEKELTRLKQECRSLASYIRYVDNLILRYDQAGLIYTRNKEKNQMDVEAFIYYKMLSCLNEIKHYIAFSQTLWAFMQVKSKVPVTPLAMPPYEDFFYQRIHTRDIIEFCTSLLAAESWRRGFIAKQKITIITIREFPLTLRNACFDEYISLRVMEIQAELSADNDRLYPPTEQECMKELYEREQQPYNQLAGMQQFRGSQAFAEVWTPSTPDVLRMTEIFFAYLKDKITVTPTPTIHTTGPVYTGPVYNIGTQNNYTYPKSQPAHQANTPKKKAQPEEKFTPDFITFTKLRTNDYNIIALYQELLRLKWIADGNPDNFTALFSGKISEQTVTWTGKVGKDNLYALFKMMADNTFIKVPDGHSLQRIVESHFVNEQGENITGIDSGKPSQKSLSVIDQLRQILAARQTFDE